MIELRFADLEIQTACPRQARSGFLQGEPLQTKRLSDEVSHIALNTPIAGTVIACPQKMWKTAQIGRAHV